MLGKRCGVGAAGNGREIKLASEQPLVEKPDPPCIGAGGRIAHHRLDRLGACRLEKLLEEQEINALVL